MYVSTSQGAELSFDLRSADDAAGWRAAGASLGATQCGERPTQVGKELLYITTIRSMS